MAELIVNQIMAALTLYLKFFNFNFSFFTGKRLSQVGLWPAASPPAGISSRLRGARLRPSNLNLQLEPRRLS